MDELIKLVAQFLEFVMLGGLALVVPLVFFRGPVLTYWTNLLDAIAPRANSEAHDRARRWIGTVILLALLLFVGMIFNAAADAALEPAHFYVIARVVQHMEKGAVAPGPVDPDWTFVTRPLSRSVPQDEHEYRKKDSRRRGSMDARS